MMPPKKERLSLVYEKQYIDIALWLYKLFILIFYFYSSALSINNNNEEI